MIYSLSCIHERVIFIQALLSFGRTLDHWYYILYIIYVDVVNCIRVVVGQLKQSDDRNKVNVM